MNRMKKVIAIVTLAVIMTVAAAVKMTWAEVTETEYNSTESVQVMSGTAEDVTEKSGEEAGQEAANGDPGSSGSPSDAAHDSGNSHSDSGKANGSFDISDKEVQDIEDVTFDVEDDTKPDVSMEEAPAGDVVITVTEEDIVVLPDKEDGNINIPMEPIQTDPVKTEDIQVIVESQETEILKPETQVTVKTEIETSTFPEDITVISEKEITAVEIAKVKEPSDIHTQVTVIPAGSAVITQEVVPNVITESPVDTKEPEKKPEQPESGQSEPGQRPSRHPSGGNHHEPSVILTVQRPQIPEKSSDETVTAVVPDIIQVPEKTSIPVTDVLPKTGDTISLHGIICLLSGIGIVLVLVSDYKEAVLKKNNTRILKKGMVCKETAAISDSKAVDERNHLGTMGIYSRFPIPIRTFYKRIVQGQNEVVGRMS